MAASRDPGVRLRPPAPPPSRLLVVAAAFEAVDRVRRALGGEFALVRCAGVAEARAALGEAPVAGALLEPRDAQGAPTAPLVRELRARGGSARPPVVAMVRRSAPWCAATVALLEAHPALVLVAEDLDLGSVTRLLSTRLRRAEFVSAVWRDVAPDVPAELRPLVHAALARAGEPLSVGEIAAELGLHRKTLWARCRRHGVGSVQALMTWCRLLAAEHALRTGTRSVDAIAEELAFASPTALRNAVRRYLGTTPSALRVREGEGAARAGFRAWMRQATPPDATLGDVA